MTKRDTSGEITELERGHRYSIRVRLAPTPEKPQWHWSKSRKVNGNKAEATAALVEYKHELEDGISGKNITVSDYADKFQRNRKALGKVSNLTLQRDEIEINRIKEHFGDIELRTLTPSMIENIYVKMIEDEGMSKDALHKTHMKLSQILKKAYNEELINRNPCDAVEGVSRPKVNPDKKKERRITKEEAIRFAKELKNEKRTGKVVAVWLALATGLRRGEALALVWNDVDLPKKALHIRRQFGKEKTLKEPKTARSKRTISIDSETVEFLKQWKIEQAEQFRKAGIRQSKESPVCSNELCDFTDPDNFSRWRRSFFVKHGLAHYEHEEEWTDSRGIRRIKRSGYVGPNFHALRHAQATLLVAGGVDPKTVQARLGHESLNTTLNIYAEEVAENDVKAADYIGSLFE